MHHQTSNIARVFRLHAAHRLNEETQGTSEGACGAMEPVEPAAVKALLVDQSTRVRRA